jgi:large subunit ribosomal protein L18
MPQNPQSSSFRRQHRTRARMFGLATKPRISVFRSNTSIYVQAIDDENSKTLISFSDIKEKKSNCSSAEKVGKEFAKLLAKKKIKKGVFDRGPYAYHGRVKALAEALRNEGFQI